MPYSDENKQREWQKEWKRKKRLETIEKLGGHCIYCGCDIVEALEINHKSGGGRQSRKHHVRPHTENIDELELTCIVCNAWHKAVKLLGIPDNWKIIWNNRKT